MELTENSNPSSSKNGYLFEWNPDLWPNWADPKDPLYIENNIKTLKSEGSVSIWWNCKSKYKIKIGDRAFLVKVGVEPKGIMASGTVDSNSHLRPGWEEGQKKEFGVEIKFDTLLNPDIDPILTLDKLQEGHLADQEWTPQGSGVSMKNHEVLVELEKVWLEFLTTHKRNPSSVTEEAKEIPKTYPEGVPLEVTLTQYERNPDAREACLKHYDYSCSVCDFNFEKVYGSELGKNYIHVHHLIPMAERGQEYMVDPIKDLRPVCPNCHSMLHRKNPPWEIDELKEKMENAHRQ